MVYFYVYKLTDIKTFEYYFGSRTSKEKPENDIKYKIVKNIEVEKYLKEIGKKAAFKGIFEDKRYSVIS